jgi:hypothetical protein
MQSNIPQERVILSWQLLKRKSVENSGRSRKHKEVVIVRPFNFCAGKS